jgi:hypothetical protein
MKIYLSAHENHLMFPAVNIYLKIEKWNETKKIKKISAQKFIKILHFLPPSSLHTQWEESFGSKIF